MIQRSCRECGIDHIEPGMTTADGDVLCWAEDDLCSFCQDRLQRDLEADAARYRFLRNRQTRSVDFAVGGVFAGRVPENQILGGEDLDRAIDAERGLGIPDGKTLESRLAACLSECIDSPLLNGFLGGDGRIPTEVRLGFFRPDIGERAAELLEEFGI